MITEEMRQVWYGSDLSFDAVEADKKIQRIIELHEQSKPKHVESWPACDICVKELDYHPKHFSSSTNPHIHICDDCVNELGYERFLIDFKSPTREPLSEDEQ